MREMVLAVGWTLVHFVWQGAVVASVLGAVLFALRRRSPQCRYVVACAAMVAMATFPLVTCFLLFLRGSAAPRPAGLALGSSYRFSMDSLADPVASTWAAVENALPLLVSMWGVGALVLALRMLGGWLVVRRMCRLARPVSSVMAARASELAAALEMRTRFEVRYSDSVQVPSVVGCFRAIVLLPASALTGMPAGQLEALLAHELAHVRRHDYLVNLCQTVVETVLFYHPAVWWVSGRIRSEREHCCDDMAVSLLGDLRTYANALVTLEELRASPLAVAAAGGELLPRIRRILGEPMMQTNRNAAWLAVVLAAALVAAPFAVTRGKAESPGKPAKALRQVPATAQEAPSADPFADRLTQARPGSDEIAELKARIQELERENARLRERGRDSLAPSADARRSGLTREERPAVTAERRAADVRRQEVERARDMLRDQARSLDQRARGLAGEEARMRDRALTAETRRGEALRGEDLARIQGQRAQEDLHRAEVERDLARELYANGIGAARAEQDRARSRDIYRSGGDLTTEIRALREENMAIKRQMEDLRRMIESLKPRQTSVDLLRELRVADLVQQRHAAELELSRARTMYSDKHPRMAELRDQLMELDRQLARAEVNPPAGLVAPPARP